MSLNSCTLRIDSAYSNTAAGDGAARAVNDTFTNKNNFIFSSGTGDNQVDLPWSYSPPGAGQSGAATFVLSALANPAAGGAAYALARVRKLYFRNAGAFPIVLGGAASNAWTPLFPAPVTVPAGGVYAACVPAGAALPVAAGSNDQLKVDCGAHVVPYYLELGGCSA